MQFDFERTVSVKTLPVLILLSPPRRINLSIRLTREIRVKRGR
jgi:hypothetical protein